jgi:hypothetical protein
MPSEKLFTLAEAQALIPYIGLIMEKMQRINLNVREEIDTLTREHGASHLPELSIPQLLRLKPSLRPLFEELAQAVHDIEKLGCHFKGLELGLVDFPAQLDGEVVELCWQYGEREIAFYHQRNEGFTGRQPLKAQQRKSPYYQQ